MLPRGQLWGLIALAWLLWGAISVLRLVAVPELGWRQAFWYGFPDAVIWALLTPLLIRAARHVEIRRHRLFKALAFHAFAAAGFVVVHASIDTGFWVINAWLGGQPSYGRQIFLKILSYGFHTNLLVYIMVLGFVQYLDRTRWAMEEQRRAAQLEAELAVARLAGLERQLQPHFLFNALNTISSLMGEEPETGRRVVRRLGDLLRASLKHTGRSIPLGEEIELLRCYLAIEQARFEDALTVDVRIDPDLPAAEVPPLILQPLVENAIAYGVTGRPGGGHLRVDGRREGETLCLSVQDDGPGLGAVPNEHRGLGLGLANVEARLKALYGDGEYLTLEPVNVDPSAGENPGLRVSLRLPMARSRS